MNRGFASVGFVVALITVVLVGGGGYWFVMQEIDTSPVVATPTLQANTNTMVQVVPQKNTNTNVSQNTSSSIAVPSATILQSSLSKNSPNPTITGTVTGTSAICAWIGKGSVTVPSQITEPDAMPGYAWGVCSKTGAIVVAKGEWSTALNPSLENGTYTIAISDGETNHVLASAVFSVAGSQGAGMSGGTPQYVLSNQQKLATTADLSATIDSTVVASPHPTFSGGVSGSMTHLLGMNLYRKNPSYHGYYSGNVQISNGRWSASLETQLPAGTYIVDMYILDGHSNFGSNNVVTTATLNVQ